MHKDDMETKLRWNVHGRLKPMFKKLVSMIGRTNIVKERLKAGFNQEWIGRMHKALHEFCEIEPSTVTGDHCFKDYGKPFIDVICVLMDSERFWSPRRYRCLLETLDKYDLYDMNNFPKLTEEEKVFVTKDLNLEVK